MRLQRFFSIRVAAGLVLAGAAPVRAAAEGDPVQTVTGWVFRILNFLIVFGAFGYLYRKFGRQFFARRSERIADAIAAAACARQEAEAELRAIEEKLSSLEAYVAELRSQAQQEAAREAERIRALARNETEKIERAVQAEIAAAERATLLELKAFAARMAVERAEAIIRKQINSATQARMFRSFVDRLERSAN